MKNNVNQDDNIELNVYFKEICQYKLLSAEEEIHFGRLIKKGCKNALEILINSNLRLVVKIAKSWKIPELSYMDLIQEGNLGLMHAAEKFDPEKGIRFSTYSSWWIKQSILRAISWKRRSIRLPLRLENEIRQFNELSREFVSELCHEPSHEELADYAHLDQREVCQLLSWNTPMNSLNAEINPDGDTVMDLVDDDTYNPEKLFLQKDMKKEIHDYLNKLRDWEKSVIMQRYALSTGKKQSFRSISQKLGVSPETVRQTEIRALKKLRSQGEELRAWLYS